MGNRRMDMERSPVTVVGAGIAGIACARALTAGDVPVRVLERATHSGGRMATPHVDGRPVDDGAAYFTVNDEEFAGQVETWRQRGLAQPWTDTFSVAAGGAWSTTTGPLRWAASAGLAGLVADLARDLDVTYGHAVRQVEPGPSIDGVRCAAAVLAMPDPQAAGILSPELAAASDAVRERSWQPVLALTAAFARRRWSGLSGAFVNHDDVLALIVDDGDRRGDGAPVLVTHSTSELAARHDVEPARAEPDMLARLETVLGPLGTPELVTVRRWRYARPAHPRDRPFHLDRDGIGLCGDGWGTPRVETAWRSGTDLGRALVRALR